MLGWIGAALILASTVHAAPLPRVVVAPDSRGFVVSGTDTSFHPWGMNYGNAGRLMEDFWDADWETFATDFREMKALGANVVRVHLQFGKFMKTAAQPDEAALRQLTRMLRLAEETGLYLDVTGLASYRPADVPPWYDALDEPGRWAAQAAFWEAVAKTCAGSTAVFCYDLANEVISPAVKREPGQWRSGNLFGGFDFVQFIALDPAGRSREEIARAWIRRLTGAIRKHDREGLITLGLLPWSEKWKHLSGIVPAAMKDELDFISVHIYPDTKLPGEAMAALKQCDVGRPVVIEETFALSCTPEELEKFLLESRSIACGWIGHYDGETIAETDAAERAGKLTMKQAAYREWLRAFVRLRPQFVRGEK